MPFSTEFYEIKGKTIYFKNIKEKKLTVPFTANLKDGVVYDNSSALIVSISEGIDISDSTLQIIGSKGFSQTIAINQVNRSFVWDGSARESGTYKMNITIQGKIFEGQFIIK